MIVADTNVISYLLLPTLYSDSMDKLYKMDSDWVAPALWKSEFIALAHYLNIPLVTQDKKILKEFPSTALSISDLLSR